MATYSATVSSEGSETIVRICGKLNRPYSLANVQEIEETGEIILTPIPVADRQDSWAAFLDDLSGRPRDEDFMNERPMNRLPVDRQILSED